MFMYVPIFRCKYTAFLWIIKGKVLKLCSSDKKSSKSFLFSDNIRTFGADFIAGSVMLPLGISNNIVGKNKAFAIIRVQPKA